MDTRVLMAIFLTIFTILFIWLLIFTIFYIIDIFNIDYLNTVNIGSQDLASNGPVVFTTNTVLTGSAIKHVPNTSIIELRESGVYEIAYNVTVESFPTLINPKSVVLKLDGNPVPGSKTSTNLCAVGTMDSLSATVLVEIKGYGKVELVNLTNDTRFTNANLVVIKIE